MESGRGTCTGEFLNDSRLIDQRLKVVEHRRGVPDIVALAQDRELVLALVAQAASILLEALKLVDEFVHHVPQPSIWQLQER